MKLYEAKEGIKITGLSVNDKPDVITFHHIDGAYSYCTTEDGSVVHLSAATELEANPDGTFNLKESE